jgi:dTMP kinase
MKNFITIEGCDGVGKTCQARLLREYCSKSGYDNIVFTREPGGSKIAEKIRNIILDAKNEGMSDLSEAFLYAASRVQHLDDVVKPALAEGKIVICDRFVHSSYAYQGYALGLGVEKVVQLNEIAVGEYLPEFVIFLDLSPALAFSRKGGVDNSDRLEVRGKEFHTKVYEGYKMLIASAPEKFVVIDASGSKEQTHDKIVAALKDRGIL